jgi:hypothetical protein
LASFWTDGDEGREPLDRACRYEPIEEIVDSRGGVGVPLVRMRKALSTIVWLAS